MNGSRLSIPAVTFSYTFSWYTWEDWEKLLDWAALRGINLQLAWVGYEKIFLESFRDLGMTEEEILSFFSGPAFQSWNRFGNIKGSWGGVGGLPLSWIETQFDMQKKIVARMVELGITPVLPAFPGFVPDAIRRVRPEVNVTRSKWLGVSENYTGDYFLDPLSDASAELQNSFITKQIEAFGNVTNIYTLDQFNELTPSSGETEYLSDVSKNTYKAITAANPSAIWLMQGWLFYSSSDFWTQERINAYLRGVEEKSSMLLLDLYSESNPQWQRTKNYAGRPWIWCQLHNFGGNMNMFGKVTNVTVDPIEAVKASDSIVGFGITPEAYEGNEVVYDILLDQAWSPTAIDTKRYFHDWATLRYGGIPSLPRPLYEAWQLLLETVYDNSDPNIPSAGIGVYQNSPTLTGLVNRTGHFPPPTALGYDPKTLVQAWSLMKEAANKESSLWNVPAFQLDFVDVTRQVMSNAFIDIYLDLVQTYNSTMDNSNTRRNNKLSGSNDDLEASGKRLLKFLDSLDQVLSTNEHFTLEKWLRGAKHWADVTENDKLFSFNARSQVTVWFWTSPVPPLNDYSARAWSGLAGGYYRERWSIFIDALHDAVKTGHLDEDGLRKEVGEFEQKWQYDGFEVSGSRSANKNLKDTVDEVQRQWPNVFGV